MTDASRRAEVLELFVEAARLGGNSDYEDGLHIDRTIGNSILTARRLERQRATRWHRARKRSIRTRQRSQRRHHAEVKEQWMVAERMERAERRAYILSLPPLEIRSSVCGACGAVVEHRPGVAWAVHLGQAASSRCRRA